MAPLLPLIYGVLALSVGAQAQTLSETLKAEEQARLNACLERQKEEPEEAYEDGLAWLMEGNRPGARYCTATSLIELGKYAEGADRLVALAGAPDGGTMDDRAIYLAQAGNAWLVAGLPEEAIATLDDAIRISEPNPDLYKDRARAYLMLEKWEEGESDLNSAVNLQPGDLDTYLLRAEARLRMEEYDAAMADIQQARAIDGENIDALVLRGRIREALRIAGEN